jgi:hypothetical protein
VASDEDGRYSGKSMAVHAPTGAISPTPAGPVRDAPIYVGQSQPMRSTLDSPAQWDGANYVGPLLQEPNYHGMSQAIHVFGEPAVLPPRDPIPACRCCTTAGEVNENFNGDAQDGWPAPWTTTGDAFTNGSSGVLLPLDSGSGLSQSKASRLDLGIWDQAFDVTFKMLFLTVPVGSTAESSYIATVGGSKGASVEFDPCTVGGKITLWGVDTPLVGTNAVRTTTNFVANVWYRFRWQHLRPNGGADTIWLWLDTDPPPSTPTLTYSGMTGSNADEGHLDLFDIAIPAHVTDRWYFDWIVGSTTAASGDCTDGDCVDESELSTESWADATVQVYIEHQYASGGETTGDVFFFGELDSVLAGNSHDDPSSHAKVSRTFISHDVPVGTTHVRLHCDVIAERLEAGMEVTHPFEIYEGTWGATFPPAFTDFGATLLSGTLSSPVIGDPYVRTAIDVTIPVVSGRVQFVLGAGTDTSFSGGTYQWHRVFLVATGADPSSDPTHYEITFYDGSGADTCACLECEDPDNPGEQILPFTPGYMPIFRRQIGDPTTLLDRFICTFESGAMVLDWHRHGCTGVRYSATGLDRRGLP